jgi:hypothetical protein
MAATTWVGSTTASRPRSAMRSASAACGLRTRPPWPTTEAGLYTVWAMARWSSTFLTAPE